MAYLQAIFIVSSDKSAIPKFRNGDGAPSGGAHGRPDGQPEEQPDEQPDERRRDQT